MNGRFSIRKTEVDLGVLIRRVVEMQSKVLTTHRITVETDEGCVVLADADRITRVVMNLVSNAVKYSPRNTCVALHIEKEDLKVLFQPFGRGRSAHSLAEGTGMGLYVVKQIVVAHGGEISVHSEPGYGATFRVRLPLAKGV